MEQSFWYHNQTYLFILKSIYSQNYNNTYIEKHIAKGKAKHYRNILKDSQIESFICFFITYVNESFPNEVCLLEATVWRHAQTGTNTAQFVDVILQWVSTETLL